MEDFNPIDLLEEFFSILISFIPRFLGALAVLIIGWLIVRSISRLIRKILEKIKINRLSDYINNMSIFGNRKLNFSLRKIISTFIYYFLMLIVWVAAADILGIEAVTSLLQGVVDYLPNLVVAFIYLMVGVFLADLARKFILNTLTSLGIPSSRLIAGFIFYFLVVNILLGALTQARINTEFIAGNISIILAGIVLAFAIGYGLASKDVAGNLISSFYWKDKFTAGDHLNVEGVEGEIIKIEKSHLILKKSNDTTIIIPMSKVSKSIMSVRKSDEG